MRSLVCASAILWVNEIHNITLALGSGLQTKSGRSLPSMSAFEPEARLDDFAREEMQEFTMQADEHASRSFTTPVGFLASHVPSGQLSRFCVGERHACTL